MRLVSHAHYIPGGRIPIQDVVTAAGGTAVEAKAFGRLFGFETVARTAPETDLNAAFSRVLDGLDCTGAKPEALIYVHGNPVQYAAISPAERLRDEHPVLAQVSAVYEMDQQNCSSLYWAFDAAAHLIADGVNAVAVIAGDSLRDLPAGERYAPGVTAIGDAYAAFLLDGQAGGIQIGQRCVKTRPEFHFGRFGDASETGTFNEAHTGLVNAILDTVGFDRAGDAPILPHNVNRLSWRKYAKDSGLAPDRIWLDLLPEVGHCYTVDAALMLDRFEASDHAEAAMLSVGQGGFLGGCMLRKEAA